jgi:branched-chain amino acid transport system ATP-binding protein
MTVAVPLAEGGVHRLIGESVNVAFSGVVALRDVTFEAERGEIVGLIGPNGAGKTTLLNVLSGFQDAGGGSVKLGDQDVTRWRAPERARGGLARTFQGVRLFARLTVRENIALGALGQRVKRAEVTERLESLMERFDLAEVANVEAGALPYGAERRLGIARALAGAPDFLLLDEPAAGLNEAESEALVQTIRKVRDDMGCAVVMIEHDMRLVMSLCERIQVLDHGQTLATGTPQQVRSDQQVIDAYLGVDLDA